MNTTRSSLTKAKLSGTGTDICPPQAKHKQNPEMIVPHFFLLGFNKLALYQTKHPSN